MQTKSELLDTAPGLIHRQFSTSFLPRSKTGQYWQVHSWSGTYLGTFDNERDARAFARRVNDRYDPNVSRVYA
jgi:hypothetical protein